LVLLMLVAVSLASSKTDQQLAELETEILELSPHAAATTEDNTDGGDEADDTPAGANQQPQTTFKTNHLVSLATELDSLPPGAEGVDRAATATDLPTSSFDVATMVGITLGVFFFGVIVFFVVMAMFRRSNLINDKNINSGGSREYHLPWKRHQIVFLTVIAIATVLLTIGAALAYYFVATSTPALGSATTTSRALIQTPPNGPEPNWGAPCSNVNSPECISTWLAITNKARAKERVRAMVLPKNYASLSIANQNRVLVNLERKDRGLPTFPALVSSLNKRALSGAIKKADPIGPSGKSWGSNWCGSANAILCNYLYMYWDGPGGTNIECKSRSSPGCWGHRKNIIRKWGSKRLHMGAAVRGQSSTQLFVAG